MASRRIRAGGRQRQLSGSLVLLLAVYFLSLCTQCTLVHAGLFSHQAAQTHRTSAAHCSLPSVAPETACPLTSDHENSSEPVCCKLMGVGKAISPVPLQLDCSPLLTLTSLLPAVNTPAWGVHQLHGVRVGHFFHPPPLYLLHATFLI